MNRTFTHFLGIFLLVFSVGLTSCNSKIEDLTSTDDKNFTCTYKNTKRTFFIDFSEQQVEPAPVIFMLHGYGSSAKDFKLQTGFSTSANSRGYSVVYIDGIPDPDDKTSSTGWNSGIKTSSKDDLGFLINLQKVLQQKYNFSKFYAVGFSNGAFMIHRLAVQSKSFTACASIAGFLPEAIWKKRPAKIKTAFLQINGTKDDVVPMIQNGSAKRNKNPAIEDVIEYYKKAYSNPDLIEYILIQDGRHSWPQKQFAGFDVNEVILDFFDKF